MQPDLDIPDFLRRPFDPAVQVKVSARLRQQLAIPYPPDGYLGKGLHKKARERLRASRRRWAEKCRERN